MLRRPPRSTRTSTLFPSSPLCRSGTRLVAILGQARLRDAEFRRGVLVDRPQQFETALGALRVAFLAIGAVALQTIGCVDDQRLASARRSEEHTSELQSLMRISYAVFCLKNKKDRRRYIHTRT